MDSTDKKQQEQIDGLERRERLVLACVILGAIGSVAQIWEAFVITWRGLR